MSKDWTPVEQILAEKELKLVKGVLLRDTNRNLKISNGKGEFTPAYSEEQIARMDEYPTLSFLFSGYLTVYEKMPNKTSRDTVLGNVEKELSQIAEKSYGSLSIDLSEFTETIVLWYVGKLCSHFYYNEENNENFADYLLEQYNQLEE